MKVACPACGLDVSIDENRAGDPTNRPVCERCGEKLELPAKSNDDDAPVLEIGDQIPDLANDDDQESVDEADWSDLNSLPPPVKPAEPKAEPEVVTSSSEATLEALTDDDFATEATPGPAPAGPSSWIVDLGGDVHETMSALEISELYARGTVRSNTRVREPGSDDWREIALVDALTRLFAERGISIDSAPSDGSLRSETDFAAETREINATELWKAAGVEPANSSGENWVHDAETQMVDSRRLLEQAGLDPSVAAGKSASKREAEPKVAKKPPAIAAKKVAAKKKPPARVAKPRPVGEDDETLLYEDVGHAKPAEPASNGVQAVGIALFVALLLLSVVLAVMASMKVN